MKASKAKDTFASNEKLKLSRERETDRKKEERRKTGEKKKRKGQRRSQCITSAMEGIMKVTTVII
jgi:hypothetical protein